LECGCFSTALPGETPVDKALSGIKALQTLSRLNRAHPKKHDVSVLDFQNDTKLIEESLADYYRTTILSKETDPNKLHTLKGDLDKYQVYSPEQIDALVEMYLSGADRDKLDPILDACVAVYVTDLDEDKQVDFKGKAKTFTRTCDFLATIQFCNGYTNIAREMRVEFRGLRCYGRGRDAYYAILLVRVLKITRWCRTGRTKARSEARA